LDSISWDYIKGSPQSTAVVRTQEEKTNIFPAEVVFTILRFSNVDNCLCGFLLLLRLHFQLQVSVHIFLFFCDDWMPNKDGLSQNNLKYRRIPILK
jgi:hypothetical protein